VFSASSVNQALQQIAAQPFDILVTDLHMPDPGDGFAVITAMRHSQPEALTVVASDYPDVQRALQAVLLQADEILVKPFGAEQLRLLMGRRKLAAKTLTIKEGAAAILDRDVALLIKRWLERVQGVPELAALPLPPEVRAAYLPQMIASITTRLRGHREIDLADIPCPAAVAHGRNRYLEGYSAPLVVQESRLLQVSIFEAIQRNLSTVDFTVVLPDIMIIAEEVDSQLKQTIASFLAAQGEKMAAASA
jgi:CheY-like chemotaxis protein